MLANANRVEAMEFREYLRHLREKKGYSIRQLALLSGVSNAYLSQVETGNRGTPSPEVLRRLAKPLGVAYERLLEAAGYLTAEDSVALSDSAVTEKRNEKGEVTDVRVATEAAHRTDGYDDELPEDARRALEEYKEFLRQKYRKK